MPKTCYHRPVTSIQYGGEAVEVGIRGGNGDTLKKYPGKSLKPKSPYIRTTTIYIYTQIILRSLQNKLRHFTNGSMWQNISSINIEQDCERTRKKCTQLVLFMANSVGRTLKH